MAKVQTEQRLQLLEQLPRSQRERLSHIDFKLYFLGELRRSDVVERFETGPAGATRDIAMYREIAPENLQLDPTTKAYLPTLEFTPLFEHQAQRVLTALSQGFGEGIGENLQPMVRCEFPNALSLPKMSVLAPITRAIHRGKAVRLGYTSIDSGKSEREIVPLALVDTGIRWHVRAFDRKSQQFRDFVLTRMANPTVLDDAPVDSSESAEHDVQWSRLIELELVPHPAHPRPEVVQSDYEMPDGVLKVKVRAANAGYILRRWSVDCSPDHSLRGPEYALWLADPLALYGATSASLAPGYKDPRPEGERRVVRAL
ncbi:WYL domain-containing protein [Paraburkholderia sp. CNPSo 3076]|uniref:WYL domain-containing protein n=1 Tax=Paraburkholderia sp. CNPSo 3076 TaxID=2940936 RepID=UPI00224F1EB0|nr:WYL domain-containing protein [Paraburkholderia sp. CNPSo 3076]MCX5545234.1 WYL domain-containing protein [Paraburkholderia sp. CNPSo 3076]